MIRISQILAFLALAGSAAAEEPSAADLAFFEKRIRPILIERCYECHSEEADKRKGGLWLDRRAGWEVGGDSGTALVPGDPDESLIVEMIRYGDPDIAMPPKEKLPPEEIALLEDWIKRGAPDPRDGATIAKTGEGIDIEAGREFWSFQPIANPEPPAAADAKTDIDRFVRAKFAEAGLKPMAEADPESLLRRLTIALTGLPPTIEEQDRFLSGDENFEAVVDRLLESRGFAERWGRHWLDITRYSDTSGGGRAMALPEAWRFRDYVIDSFHKNKPLDQFIREQVAGDLLPFDSREQRAEQLSASGFLVLGPHNYENQDKEMLDLEIADEQMDTIGRAFMGMTIGCARCHDHKFDPIPTADYYALAGIFLSTDSVTHSNVSKWHLEPFPPTPEETAAMTAYKEKEAELKKVIDGVKAELRALGKMDVGAKGNSVAKADLAGIVLDDAEAELTGDWMKSTSQQRWVDAGYIHDKTELKGEKSVEFKPKVEKPGRYEVRIAYSSGTNRASNVPITIRHAEGETKVVLNQNQLPKFDNLTSSVGVFAFKAGEASIRITTEGTNGVVIADAVQLLPEGAPGLVADKDKPKVEEDAPDQQLLAELEERQKTLEAEMKTFQKTKPAEPMIMSAADVAEVADTPIRIRGITRNFGPMTPRGVLRVALPANATGLEIPEGQSGRLELADWIVSSENPLTARVMANRIWQHLFGEGLVSTPDNFGTTGRLPSHPKLLDHLATRLVESDWSAKALVREIVLTETFRQASDESPDADPGNLLLSHFPRRRVDAESLRDSILMVSGALDSAHGGPSLPPGFRSEFGFKFTSLKRTVYIPVFRNQPHEIQAAFDFANPNFVVGKRSQGTIPTQSLYLTNSPEIHAQAKLATEQLLADTPDADVETRITIAWRKFLSRRPNAEELAMTKNYVESSGAESPEAWESVMRGLFACVDFQWIR
ncbi:MAG: hypothetical protein ACI8UO_001999 [Verrucomicrobiales bacterium]|jgi:hypothetical protein